MTSIIILSRMLPPTGQAGVKATEIATTTRAINMIYANMTVPNLRTVSSPDDLPYLKQVSGCTCGLRACMLACCCAGMLACLCPHQTTCPYLKEVSGCTLMCISPARLHVRMCAWPSVRKSQHMSWPAQPPPLPG